jgi:hypothetical protein
LCTYSNKFEGVGQRSKSLFCRKKKVAESRLRVQKRCKPGRLTSPQFILKGVAKKRKMEENPLKKEMQQERKSSSCRMIYLGGKICHRLKGLQP